MRTRRADALGLVAESALAGGLDPGNSADRFQVTVHVQADTLAAREAAGEARRVFRGDAVRQPGGAGAVHRWGGRSAERCRGKRCRSRT